MLNHYTTHKCIGGNIIIATVMSGFSTKPKSTKLKP